MLKKVQNFLKEEEGATMIEYALIAALISIAAVTILPALGTKILDTFTAVNKAIPTPAP